MKPLKQLLCITLLPLLAAASWAQDDGIIYRCGNEYTNNAAQARANKNCKRVDGGHVTVVSPGSGAGGNSGGRTAQSPPNAPKVSGGVQRMRDSDARAILQTELDGTRQRLEQLRSEYNDGNPVKSALELRNPQPYIERVEQLKAEIARAESDVAGIEREIARLP